MSDPLPSSANRWPALELPKGRIFPAQLALAADLLARIDREGLPADRALQRELAGQRKMGRRDRERVRELVLFVLRHRRVIDWLLGDAPPAMAARVGVAIVLADRIDPVLAEAAGLPPQRVEQIETARFCPFAELPRAVRFNLSPENEAHWRALDPTEPEALARALDERAPVDLHVNPRRQTTRELQDELAQDEIETTPIAGLPCGLRLARPARLTRLPAFLEGGFEVQDAGSQWIVQAVAPQPGERVLDLCAGAGGKTLGILDETRGAAAVTACDLHGERLERLRLRAERHGDHHVALRALDATAALPADLTGFDRVLIDAPCSGSGTWRRHPELRWASVDWAGLATTQRRLLAHGAAATRPGGWLVYATCSLWRAENEEVVADFLSRHAGWQLETPATGRLPDDALDSQLARLRPDHHHCDGFFIACLRAPASEPA